MNRMRVLFGMSLVLLMGRSMASAASSFICSEPGGKRLLQILEKEIDSVADGKMLLYISGNNIQRDPHSEAILVVDDHDIRHSPAGVKLAVFDGQDIRHGTGDKVLINYKHPSLSPTFRDDRVYSIEGPAITKQQLVAALYLLRPGIFDLTPEETKAQQDAMKEANAEAEQAAAADQIAGTWRMLNGYGPVEKTGNGTITVSPKKGAAYPVTLDLTKNGGPNWTGVGVYSDVGGSKLFWLAYGTPKTIGLCVYEIKGSSLEGKWYPWYIDGDAKNVGTETLKGPETFGGEYTIVSAKSPTTGAAYSGTVTIKPLTIVGSDDNTKPYQVTWNLGGAKIEGIGIRTKNFLYVSSGTGADVNVAKFELHNGTMNSDWYKLGSKEMGKNAAMNNN